MIYDLEGVHYADHIFTLIKEQMIYGLDEYPINFKKVKDGNPKFVLLLGDNATGKSYFNDIVQAAASSLLKYNVCNLNFKLRTSSGLNKMFMAMDDIVSTGAGSLSNVMNSLQYIVENHSDKNKLIILDEPTIGFSERFEAPMGEFLALKMAEFDQNEKIKGLILTTHSKKMIKRLVESDVSFCVYLTGNKYQSLDDWLNDNNDGTLEELLSLGRNGMDLYRKIHHFKQE